MATHLATTLLALIRGFTRQWWILRGSSESAAPLAMIFQTDAIGQPVERSTLAVVSIAPWLGSEALLSQSILDLACRALADQRSLPFSISTFFDSIWTMAQGDQPRALLDAAVACEAAFTEEAFSMAQSGAASRQTVRAAVKGHQFTDRIHHDAKLIFGRSFREEYPHATSAMNELWLARHALAHGSPRGRSRVAALNSPEMFAAAMNASVNFFEWVHSLRNRDSLDPWSGMRAPLSREVASTVTLDGKPATG